VRRPQLFTTIRTEGGLLPADLLSRVASLDRDLDGLSPEAYHLLANERIGEAVTRSWNRMVGAWTSFRDALEALPTDDRATTVTRRFLLALFQELGYGQLQAAGRFEVEGKPYPVSHEWGNVPIHLVGARLRLDEKARGVAGAATMSPHGTVQELLNRSDGHLWGFVANGTRLRLLRDNAALTRQAFVEFDLEAMFTGQVYADFVVLWMVCHQSRVEGDPPEKCLLEAWSAEAAARGTRALDQLRVGVEAAINELGAGFLAHPANAELRDRLRSGGLDKQDYYRQLLRLVYRLLFLLVAESRDLLLDPAGDATARARYREWYSLDRLRRIAEERRGGPHADLWRQLRLVFAWLGREGGQPALGLPALGSFLWSSRATPDLDGADLANANLLSALRTLTVLRDDKERVARHVDYCNLGAEELGSVYESLLELHPIVDVTTGAFSLGTAGGNERKTTGSYYTPSSLISELLDSALEPVLDDSVRGLDKEGAERALLAVTVLDPACGSRHFLIAAAQRIAKRLAALRADDAEPGPDAVHEALRDVVAHCIHGIDVNEMAVELCKVSLWMESTVPGRPLSFLDHRIVCGNSLVGATPRLLAAGVPDEAFKAITGDDKAVVTALRKSNKQQRERALAGQGTFAFGPTIADLQVPVRRALAEVDAIEGHSVAGVAEKEQRWAALQHLPEAQRARLAADAWCAAFVAPKRKGEPAITDAVARRIARGEALEADVLATIERLHSQYRFLHLHLAFPHVLRVPDEIDRAAEGPGWEGGFSVVIGNPPWERVKLQEKEFFAERSPDIANAPNAAARRRCIAALAEDDPSLFADYRDSLRRAEAEKMFLRDSGRYPDCGRGDVNTYSVFAESMAGATSVSGRCGMILPTGIGTEDTTRLFFSKLVQSRRIVSMYGFDHRCKLFTGVQMQFCLLTLGRATQIQFAFALYSPKDRYEPDRSFLLTAEDIELLNPNTMTCPVMPSRRDVELAIAVYRRLPILTNDRRKDGNPWAVTLRRMFHMTDDADLFRTKSELEAQGCRLAGNLFIGSEQRFLPLYEDWLVGSFDHRFQSDGGVSATAIDHEDPTFVPIPRYWVREDPSEQAALGRTLRPTFGFRNRMRNSDARSLVGSVIPAYPTVNTLPLLHTAGYSLHIVAAVLSSFVFDFFLRQKAAGMNLNYFIFKQIPVVHPDQLQEMCPWDNRRSSRSWVHDRSLELVYSAWDLAGFGREVGYDGGPFKWSEHRRELILAELDACFFRLYGIERDDVDYILGTFPIVNRKDAAKYGEERTRRLILERYDALAAATASGVRYETVLDPPPADPAVAHPESTRPDWAKPPARAHV
jgi:hypothetical protein